jgi:hypothetical protein
VRRGGGVPRTADAGVIDPATRRLMPRLAPRAASTSSMSTDAMNAVLLRVDEGSLPGDRRFVIDAQDESFQRMTGALNRGRAMRRARAARLRRRR